MLPAIMGEPIENHGIVGDLRTTALVAMDGTVDFLCWPRFDSPSIFASLLDEERGGCFELAPLLDGVRRRQLYIPDTNVLLTRFLSPQGVAEISDFMAIGGAHPQQLVRRVKAIRNAIPLRMRCAPRFDYARAACTVRTEAGTIVFTAAGNHGTALRHRRKLAEHWRTDHINRAAKSGAEHQQRELQAGAIDVRKRYQD